MELGYYYHQKGMTEDAEKIFKDLGARSISQKEVIRELVKRYLNPKKYDASVIILEGMLKGAPESSELHFISGVALDGKKDKDKAIMSFKKVVPDSGFYKEAVVHVAFLYQEQKKIEEAIHFLKDVIKKLPDDPEILLYLGSFYEDKGEFQKAEIVLKQGLMIDSDNTRLRFRLGVVYDKWGKKKASIEEMKTVISLDEKDANALNYLGYTYAELGENLDEAERLIKAALKQKPDDGYITDSLGWVYYKKGLFDKALKYLEKAVSLVPDDPIILEHLGDIYLKISDKKKALQFYKRSLLKKEKDRDDLEKKIQGLSGK
jgi:tetratricopeptide (TPR) repeat protein